MKWLKLAATKSACREISRESVKCAVEIVAADGGVRYARRVAGKAWRQLMSSHLGVATAGRRNRNVASDTSPSQIGQRIEVLSVDDAAGA